MANIVNIRVNSNTKDAEKGFEKLNNRMKETRHETGRTDLSIRSLGGSFLGLATKIAGVLGLVTSLVVALKEIVKGMERTKRISGFTDAILAGFGQEFRDQLDAISGQFGQLQSDFAFTTDRAKEAFAIMTRESRSAQVGIEELSAAMGLARITGIDLKTAARTIGQAMLGNVEPLRRFVGEVGSLDQLFERLSKFGKEATSIPQKVGGGLKQAGVTAGEILNKLFEGDISGALGILKDQMQAFLESNALKWPLEIGGKVFDALRDIFNKGIDWIKQHTFTWPLDIIFTPFRTIFDLLRDLWEKGKDWIKQHFFNWEVNLDLGQFGVIGALQEIWLSAVRWIRDNILKWEVSLELGQFGIVGKLQEIWAEAVSWLRSNPLSWKLNVVPQLPGGGSGDNGGGGGNDNGRKGLMEEFQDWFKRQFTEPGAPGQAPGIPPEFQQFPPKADIGLSQMPGGTIKGKIESFMNRISPALQEAVGDPTTGMPASEQVQLAMRRLNLARQDAGTTFSTVTDLLRGKIDNAQQGIRVFSRRLSEHPHEDRRHAINLEEKRDELARMKEAMNIWQSTTQPFLRDLMQAASQSAIAGFRERLGELNLQTGMGQFRQVPGSANQAVPAVVHGGEVVGRPGPGMGGITINIFGNVDNEERVRDFARRVKDLLQEDNRRGLAF